MERVWNGVWNAMVTKVKMFLTPNYRGKLQDMTLFACLMITVQLNVTVSTNSRPFSNLDDWKHESRTCIGDTHICSINEYIHHNSIREKIILIVVVMVAIILMITQIIG